MLVWKGWAGVGWISVEEDVKEWDILFQLG